ncbi:MAG: glycoside hydrolase family 3 C-terminal domain-containing protein [Bacteroidales bacterium]|nr:glycoside hydrolase family 3 C-terminal domain-containing protein [Bacteroidales bacterium]
MKRHSFIRFWLCCLPALCLFTACCSSGNPLEEKIDQVMAQLTLDEKIALIHAHSKFSSPGVPRLGIPELWTSDGSNGVRPETLWDEWDSALWTSDSCTSYPAMTALAATWDKDLARMYGRSVGEEARYRRKNILLGPGLNICRTPLGGRNFEYMGEDPLLAGKMAVSYIQGLQSNGVACCVKHYVLNDQEYKKNRLNVNLDDRTLYEIYLRPFKMALQEGGAWSIMSSYNRYGNEHVSHSRRLLTEILKEEWGWDGAVISDWSAVHDTKGAVEGGVDLEFGSYTNGLDLNVRNAYDAYYMAQPYKARLLSGEFPMAGLDDKVRRVLRLHFRTLQGEGNGSFCSPEHFADSRRIAASGIVLLKNEGVLPMRSDARKIVVLGENAIRPMSVGGGSSTLKPKYEITPLQGIRDAYPDAEVVYQRAYQGEPTLTGSYNYGLYDLTDPRSERQLLDDALAAVVDADYVLFFGGHNKNLGQDCEGRDHASYHLPYGQDAVIAALAAIRPDMVVVNIGGSPVAMPFAEQVGAIVQGWSLGSEAGHALADVLTGRVNPSGRLPFTFPRELADGPIRTDRQYPGLETQPRRWQVWYDEGLYVGYRWYDKQEIEPRWPFGYGLSYTTFDYGKARVSTSADAVTVSLPLTNTGGLAGAEVVQLYITAPDEQAEVPVKELKGFEKVWLEPGQTKTVSVKVDRKDLARFDPALHAWVVDGGRYQALVGSSSRDIRSEASFRL